MTPFELAALSGDETGAPVTSPSFRAISEALSRLPPRGVGVLWGNDIGEEIPAYSRSAGVRFPGQAFIGGKRFSVRAHAIRHANMPARSRYKVESFITRSVPRSLSMKRFDETITFHDIFDFAAEVSWKGLTDYVRPKYRATRRVLDGTEHDIDR